MQLNKAKTLVLVKARPHASDKYVETVCCAGLNSDGTWARLFPVPFRRLKKEQQFGRWDWVEYDWYVAKNDPRAESRHVQEETIKVAEKAKASGRQSILQAALQPSIEEAEAKGMTLALLRPQQATLKITKKSQSVLDREKAVYDLAADQGSLFGDSVEALNPCPYEFRYRWTDETGVQRNHECGDWETDATFFNWRRAYGEIAALKLMQERFGEEYPAKGMAFALGTHSQRPKQWLLVGVLRMDAPKQLGLGF